MPRISLLALVAALMLTVSVPFAAVADPVAALISAKAAPQPSDKRAHEGLTGITTAIGLLMLIGGALVVMLIGFVYGRIESKKEDRG